jgi:hypothetical protein
MDYCRYLSSPVGHWRGDKRQFGLLPLRKQSVRASAPVALFMEARDMRKTLLAVTFGALALTGNFTASA